jgi:transcriptional regulator with XRE-family HTH domain
MLDTMNMTVGQRIAYLRSSRGLTQAQLGEAVGMPATTICRVEASNDMLLDTLRRMARALDTPCAYLLGEAPPPAWLVAAVERGDAS